MSAADQIRAEHADTIAMAEARARADVLLGIENLKAKLANSDEFEETGKAGGGRRIEAVAGPLRGHLRRLRAIHGDLVDA